MKKRNLNTIVSVVVGLCLLSDAYGISRRHDVSVDQYTTLAAQFPAVGQFGGCSATLVSSTKVLTAAHCLDEDADGQIDAGANPIGQTFTLGNDLRSPTASATINAYAIHPQWQATNRSAYDVCVLTLSTPITAVSPMSVTAASPVGRKAITIGFGIGGTGLQTEDNEFIKHAAENMLDAILPLDNSYDGSGALVSDFDHPNEEVRFNTLTELNVTSDNKPQNLEGSTAPGDSGGPVTVDFGSGAMVVGVTSGGFNPLTQDQSLYGDINEAAPMHFQRNVTFLTENGVSVASSGSAVSNNISSLERNGSSNVRDSGGASSPLLGLMLMLLIGVRYRQYRGE